MRAFYTILAALLLSTVSAFTPSLRAPAREIPVYEETAPPGTLANYYPLCSTVDNSAFALKIASASSDCGAKSSYDWLGLYSPTTAQRQELCSCTLLINQLQTVKIPRCSLYKDGVLVSYVQIVKFAFGLCSVGGSSSPATSTSSTTAADSNPATANGVAIDVDVNTKKSSSSSKAPVIGGVTGGVFASVFGVFGYKKYQKKKKGKDTQANEEGKTSSSADGKATAVEELSPLGSSRSSTDYTNAKC